MRFPRASIRVGAGVRVRVWVVLAWCSNWRILT